MAKSRHLADELARALRMRTPLNMAEGGSVTTGDDFDWEEYLRNQFIKPMEGGSAEAYADPTGTQQFIEEPAPLVSREIPATPPTFTTNQEWLPAPIMPPSDPGTLSNIWNTVKDIASVGLNAPMGITIDPLGRGAYENPSLSEAGQVVGEGISTGLENQWRGAGPLTPLGSLGSTAALLQGRPLDDVFLGPEYPFLPQIQDIAGDIGAEVQRGAPMAGAGIDLIRGEPLGTTGRDVGRFIGEAIVPTRPVEVAATILPKVGDIADINRALRETGAIGGSGPLARGIANVAAFPGRMFPGGADDTADLFGESIHRLQQGESIADVNAAGRVRAGIVPPPGPSVADTLAQLDAGVNTRAAADSLGMSPSTPLPAGRTARARAVSRAAYGEANAAATPASYEQAQAAIDAFESQLTARYGDDAVRNFDAFDTRASFGLDPVATPLSVAEGNELKRLYAARDAIGNAEDSASLNDLISRVPASGPASRSAVESAIAKAQQYGNLETAMGRGVSPEEVFENIYGTLLEDVVDPFSKGTPGNPLTYRQALLAAQDPRAFEDFDMETTRALFRQTQQIMDTASSGGRAELPQLTLEEALGRPLTDADRAAMFDSFMDEQRNIVNEGLARRAARGQAAAPPPAPPASPPAPLTQPNRGPGRRPPPATPPPPPPRYGPGRGGQAPPPPTGPTDAATPPPARQPRPPSVGAQVVSELKSIASMPTALLSNLTPPLLRQDKINLLVNPRGTMRAFRDSFKGLLNEDIARRIEDTSHSHPWISPGADDAPSPFRGYTADDVGLKSRSFGRQASQESREASYQGLDTSSRIGRLTQLAVSPFERQAAVELNLSVRDRYGTAAQAMWDAGERNIERYEDLATVLNNQVQYGGMPQPYDLPVLFSTRALSGRVQSWGDVARTLVQPQSVLNPGARREAAKGAAALVGANMAIMGAISQIPGADMETRGGLPILVIGPHKIDPWAGHNAIAKLVLNTARAVDNERKREGPFNYDRVAKEISEVGANFTRGALGPVLGKGADTATGKDFTGAPYSLTEDFNSGNFVYDLIAPFNVQAMVDALREEDSTLLGRARVAGATTLASLSEGVNTYYTPTERRNITRDEVSQEKYGKPFAELTDLNQRYEVDNDARVSPLIEEQLQVRASRGDPMAKNQLTDRRARENASEVATDIIDTRLSAGEMSGRDARYAYDRLVEKLAVESRGRYNLDSNGDGITDVDDFIAGLPKQELEDLPVLDQARRDYFDSVVNQSLDATGELVFDTYEAKLKEWEQRWPGYSKDTVSPSRPLSDGHKSLLTAREILRPYFNQQDEAWTKLAEANPLLSKHPTYRDYRDTLVDGLIKGGASSTVAEAEASRLLASLTTAMSQEAQLYLVNNPHLVRVLDRWGYEVPANLRILTEAP